jgi:DNA topoisomerase-3
MEESAIAEGFNNLRNGADYDNLHQAALCRQQADWAVGMNYSRLFGCLYNVKGLSIGRVQTPTLAMIVERDDRIKNFVKEPFYSVELDVAGFTAASERLKDKTQAEDIAAKCNDKTAIIKSVVKQDKSTSAPKLYDLTTLQREANRLFGYSAKQTLEYAQNLYEQKILTYPRTDSRFITEDMAQGIPALVDNSADILKINIASGINVPQIVNNAKVTDHHAIIPTAEAAKVNLDSSPAEKNILMMVCARLLTAVSSKHRYAETVVTVESEGAEGVDFTAKGKTVIDNGWKAIDDAFLTVYGKKKGKNDEQDDKSLPNLTQGQQYTAAANLKEGFTSPPKPFTEDTLLSAMENATADDLPDSFQAERDATELDAVEFRKQKELVRAGHDKEVIPIDAAAYKVELRKSFIEMRGGIGTPATRAEIIETLLRREYVIRKDKQILPTEKGIGAIKILPDADSIKSPILTAIWESDLKDVETGKMTAKEFMTAVTDYVKKAVAENKTVPEDKVSLFASSATKGEVLGKCLRCGNDVAETLKAFSCVNRACKFALWKDSKFFTAKKKKLTKAIVIAFLTEGRIFMQGLHSEKTGKPYNATIILMDDKPDSYPSYSMEFEAKKGK